MLNIVIIGKPDKNTVSQMLFQALENQGGASLFSFDNAFVKNETEVFIYETEKIKEIDMENGILIFKNNCEITGPILIKGNFTAISDSANSAALNALGSSDIPVITCSKGYDTLCFSSVEEGKAMISLQREITSFSGIITEPCEIPFDGNICEDFFSPLAATAALLLCGKKIKF